MPRKKFSSQLLFVLPVLAANLAITAASAFGQQEQTLYRFQGSTDGSTPYSTVIAYQGALYGTTEKAGDVSLCYLGCGTIFQLVPPVSKGAWTLNTLYDFQGGADGRAPWGTLVVDKTGNFYGTTYVGGLGTGCQDTAGCGTVFRLSPPATKGGAWTETALYQFQGGSDGAFPATGVVVDSAGNVFGTTTQGGNGGCTLNNGCGTVFELSPPAVVGNPWTETILYKFTGGNDGSFPQAALVAGSHGVLYGANTLGGSGCSGCGVAYQLTPPTSGGSWTFSVIYNFSNNGEGISVSGLVLRNGALFGIAANTAQSQLGGTVFKLTPSQNGTWTQKLLHSFSATGSVGQTPQGTVAFDSHGNLFGVTVNGGTGLCNFGCGIVFELSPPSSGSGAWTETVLHQFQKDGNGYYPTGLVMSGNVVYGTNSSASHNVYGSVFQVVP